MFKRLILSLVCVSSFIGFSNNADAYISDPNLYNTYMRIGIMHRNSMVVDGLRHPIADGPYDLIVMNTHYINVEEKGNELKIDATVLKIPKNPNEVCHMTRTRFFYYKNGQKKLKPLFYCDMDRNINVTDVTLTNNASKQEIRPGTVGDTMANNVKAYAYSRRLIKGVY